MEGGTFAELLGQGPQSPRQAAAFLLAVAAHPAVRSHDAAACTDYLHAMGTPPLPFRGAILIDARGQIICSSTAAGADSSVADRNYFQTAMATRRFTVGNATISRADAALTLPVALPMVSTSGTVEGMVAMGLSTDALQATFERDPDLYYEDGYQEMVDRGFRIDIAPLPSGTAWVEVDNHDDLAKAREIACRY